MSADDETWQRARRPEQKRERRDAVLAAATALLDERGVEGTSLSAIARAAGLSKANLYRYFESREAILLQVALDAFGDWIVALERGLADLAGSGDLERIAATVADSLDARPRLCALISALSSVLERNVSADAVIGFKRRLHGLIARPVAALVAAAPALTPADAAELLTCSYIFVAGLWPVANPAPIVAEVLEQEEFAAMCISFAPALREHTLALLRGFTAARR